MKQTSHASALLQRWPVGFRSVLFTMALVVTGCTGATKDTGLNEYFDEATGITVASLLEPAVFYREEPLLAANARDYVSMGPVELNRAGRRDYALWLLYWTTIDRVPRADLGSDPVYLMLDGEPMELKTDKTAQVSAPDLGRSPYAKPIDAGTVIVYPVTRDQLRRLSEARDIRIQVPGGASRGDYRPWYPIKGEFRAFARQVGLMPDAYLTSRSER